MVPSRQTVPVAVNLTQTNPSWQEVSSAPLIEGEGSGLRLCGRQAFADLVIPAAGDSLLGAMPDGATLDGTNRIRISPDAFNGRVALVSRNFVKFAFRHVRVVYEPRVASTQAGKFIMGVMEDPAIGNYATLSYGLLHRVVPSVKAPYRQEVALDYHYFGAELFWTEDDMTTTSAARQTQQGVFAAFPDANDVTGPIIAGDLMVEYCLDLYGYAVDYGFTVLTRTAEECQYLKECLDRFRAEHLSDEEKQSDDGSIRRVRATATLYKLADRARSPRV
jgi:hypothetical protein